MLSVVLAVSTLSDSSTLADNPYSVLWNQYGGDRAGLSRFYLDVAGDSRPELFLGLSGDQGNGGGQFYIFIIAADCYKFLGTVDLSAQALEVLPAQHHGVHDLRTYWHMSARDGNLIRYAFDGEKYITLSKRSISSHKYASTIRPAPISIEYSGALLLWSPETSADSLVDFNSADYGDTVYFMRIREIVRDTNTSRLCFTHRKFASSVGSSMFIALGFCKVAKARGADYFINLKEWDADNGDYMFIAGFSNTNDSDIQKVFGHQYSPTNDDGQPRIYLNTSEYLGFFTK